MRHIIAPLLWGCLLSPACALSVHEAAAGESAPQAADELPADPSAQSTQFFAVRDSMTAEMPLQREPSELFRPSVDADPPSETPAEPFPTEPELEPSVPPEPLCTPAVLPQLSGLSLSKPVQYMALRVRGESQDLLPTMELASWGSPCGDAADPVDCEIEVVNAEAGLAYESTVCDPVCKQFYFVTYAGGVVETWGSGEAVRSLLGAIDTAGEAVLLAFYALKGIDVSCAAADHARVKRIRGGYQFSVRMRAPDRCTLTPLLGHVTVGTFGEVTLTETGEAVVDPDSCS
jgi:hypothetical protein